MRLVNCGCGGKADFGNEYYGFQVKCSQCGTTGPWKMKEEDAILGWNQAMSGFVNDTNVGSKVPERKNGEWIYDTERVMGDGWTYNQYHCSECGQQIIGALQNFCSYCGADMRGEYE